MCDLSGAGDVNSGLRLQRLLSLIRDFGFLDSQCPLSVLSTCFAFPPASYPFLLLPPSSALQKALSNDPTIALETWPLQNLPYLRVSRPIYISAATITWVLNLRLCSCGTALFSDGWWIPM